MKRQNEIQKQEVTFPSMTLARCIRHRQHFYELRESVNAVPWGEKDSCTFQITTKDCASPLGGICGCFGNHLITLEDNVHLDNVMTLFEHYILDKKHIGNITLVLFKNGFLYAFDFSKKVLRDIPREEIDEIDRLFGYSFAIHEYHGRTIMSLYTPEIRYEKMNIEAVRADEREAEKKESELHQICLQRMRNNVKMIADCVKVIGSDESQIQELVIFKRIIMAYQSLLWVSNKEESKLFDVLEDVEKNIDLRIEVLKK